VVDDFIGALQAEDELLGALVMVAPVFFPVPVIFERAYDGPYNMGNAEYRRQVDLGRPCVIEAGRDGAPVHKRLQVGFQLRDLGSGEPGVDIPPEAVDE